MSWNRFVYASFVAAVLFTGLVAEASAAGPYQAGLFENYYVSPSIVGGVGSRLYPCPRPVPAWVGHTYYTYEGLYPHEFMYPHMKHYYRGSTAAHILYW